MAENAFQSSVAPSRLAAVRRATVQVIFKHLERVATWLGDLTGIRPREARSA